MFGQSDDAAQKMDGRLEVGWRARQLGRDPSIPIRYRWLLAASVTAGRLPRYLLGTRARAARVSRQLIAESPIITGHSQRGATHAARAVETL